MTPTPGNRLRDRLSALCGACPREVALLERAFAIETERRRTARAERAGLPPGALDVLLGLYLFMLGLGLGALAYLFRDVPDVMATVVLAGHGALIIALATSELHFAMLADEAFRVIASWPIRSASYLVARVLGAIRRAVYATLVVCAPAWLVISVFVGIPVITGATFLGVAVCATLAIVIGLTAVYAILLRLLGARWMRVIALVASIAAVVVPLIMAAVVSRNQTWLMATLAEPPVWLPMSWAASVISISAGDIAGHGLRAALAVLAMTVVPIGSIRIAARMYTRGLATARDHRGRGPVARMLERPFDFLIRRLSSPADAAIARLFLAHLRGDWRFRAQAIMIPCVTLAVLVAEAMGIDAGALFRDPFGPKTLFHPAMVMVVIALLPPIMAVPLVARSSDHGAAWLLHTAAVTADDLAASGRTMIRIVFIAPFIIALAAGYLAFGDEPLASLAHIAVLGLLADTALVAMHGRLTVVPFSRPADDGDLQQLAIVTFLLAYVLSTLLATFVVHVMYRWWIAYGFGTAWLIIIRISVAGASSRR